MATLPTTPHHSNNNPPAPTGASITSQEAAWIDEQLAWLSQPLELSVIKHRQGPGGRQLNYITGKTAIATANRLFGYGQWGYRVISRGHEVVTDARRGQVEYYIADIELFVSGSAGFPFPGDGVGIVTEPFTIEMHEKARKEATTDALKRALRHYGNQFGLCLYDEDDYVVDADNGTLVQVKDVTRTTTRTLPPSGNGNSRQPPRLVVVAEPPPAAAEEEAVAAREQEAAVKARLNAAFQSGKAQHLFGHKRGMATYASRILHRTVSMEELLALTDGELCLLEKALSGSSVGMDEGQQQQAQ